MSHVYKFLEMLQSMIVVFETKKATLIAFLHL